MSYAERGSGPPVLCLHETASDGRIFAGLAAALADSARVIAPDRRGWGESGAPEPYVATTIEEQAEDAATLLELLEAGPAILVGAGLGAVCALDLVLRMPVPLRGAVLVEPPLLAFLPEATEGLSGDRKRIEAAVAGGGAEAALELYLAGELPFAGAGAGRIPGEIGDAARRRPLSLFAELVAIPAWSLQPGRLAASELPVRIVVSASTPPLLREAADRLAAHLGASALRHLGGQGLPHAEAPVELGRVVSELL